VIQDATFITSYPGHAKADKPRGDDAKTRRSKEGTWTKKNNKSFFGYKLHSKEDIDYGLIREIETTTASVHDSQSRSIGHRLRIINSSSNIVY